MTKYQEKGMAVTADEARGLQTLFSAADSAVQYLLERLAYNAELSGMLGGAIANAPPDAFELDTSVKVVKDWVSGSSEQGLLDRSPLWFVNEEMTVGKYLLGHQWAFRNSQKIHVTKNESDLNVHHKPQTLLIGCIENALFPNNSGDWQGYRDLFVLSDSEIAGWF
jgi:hypothetical protein